MCRIHRTNGSWPSGSDKTDYGLTHYVALLTVEVQNTKHYFWTKMKVNIHVYLKPIKTNTNFTKYSSS